VLLSCNTLCFKKERKINYLLFGLTTFFSKVVY